MDYSTSAFNFSHFNIRSIFSSFDLFAEHVIGENYDVLGLSETWLSGNVTDGAVLLNGYNLIRNDRNGRGGGVCFYIKNSLKYKVLTVPLDDSTLEQIWVSVRVGKLNFCLGSVYRPPDSNLLCCVNGLENTLIDVLPKFDCVLFGGDLNVNYLNNDNNILQKMFNKYGLTQMVDSPTRVTNVSQTLLDIIVCSRPSLINDVNIVDMDPISDHSLVTCTLKIFTKIDQIKYRTYRDYSNFNYIDFMNDLEMRNWDHIYSLDEVDKIVEYLNININSIFDDHAPIKSSKFTKAPAPWLTENLKMMMKLRKKALSKYKKLKTDASWNYYKDLRNFVSMAVRNEKKAYLVHKFKCDPNQFWKTIRWLNIKSVADIKPEEIHNDPNQFNRHFTENIPATDRNDKFLDKNYVNKTITLNTKKFTFKNVDCTLVSKIISKLTSSAVGSDGINLKMISIITPFLTPHIAFLINKCLSLNEFPSAWKQSQIIPIPKISKPTLISHFRPISILPTLSKILEKVVHEQLSLFLAKNNILPSTQSGFRPHHSTNTALLDVTDNIFRAYDKHENTCLVLLDYSKAFDTIDHTILCKKLSYFGLDSSTVNFFQSYLENREQKVNFSNGKSSDTVSITRGVPQGSILGPLLFTIYTADFCKCLEYCSSHQYADDFQLYFSFEEVRSNSAVALINSDLAEIYKISSAHGLVLNAKKTQMVLLGRNRKNIIDNTNFKIKINNDIINSTDCCRNLGLYLDVGLRFETHISRLLQSSYGKLKQLYLHKDYLNSDIKLKLCDALILSCQSYCDTVYWPALTSSQKLSLQKLQNYCLKFSYGIRKYDHVTPLFGMSGWLTLEERYTAHLSTLVFKILSTGLPTYLRQKLIKGSEVHGMHTRYNNKLVIPKHSTALFQRSFSYNGAKLFNSLPDTVTNSPSIISFKYKLKEVLFKK